MSGGASGLGEATVKLLHAKGASLAVCDQDEDRLDELKRELLSIHGGRIICMRCDVTNELDVKKAID